MGSKELPVFVPSALELQIGATTLDFFDLDTGNPNLGPHICVAGALLAGP